MHLEMRRWAPSVFSNIQLQGWHTYEIYLHYLMLSFRLLTAILGNELKNANVLFRTEYVLYQSKFICLKTVNMSFLKLHKHVYVINLSVLFIAKIVF